VADYCQPRSPSFFRMTRSCSSISKPLPDHLRQPEMLLAEQHFNSEQNDDDRQSRGQRSFVAS